MKAKLYDGNDLPPCLKALDELECVNAFTAFLPVRTDTSLMTVGGDKIAGLCTFPPGVYRLRLEKLDVDFDYVQTLASGLTQDEDDVPTIPSSMLNRGGLLQWLKRMLGK